MLPPVAVQICIRGATRRKLHAHEGEDDLLRVQRQRSKHGERALHVLNRDAAGLRCRVQLRVYGSNVMACTHVKRMRRRCSVEMSRAAFM